MFDCRNQIKGLENSVKKSIYRRRSMMTNNKDPLRMKMIDQTVIGSKSSLDIKRSTQIVGTKEELNVVN